MLSALATRRFRVLRDFMRKLPEELQEHFYMGAFFRHDGNHPIKLDKGTVTKETLVDCGTRACAAGWAATIPEFRKAGFVMDRLGNFPKRNIGEFFNIEDTADELDSRSVSNGEAAALFYGTAWTSQHWADQCSDMLRAHGYRARKKKK